MVPSALPKMFLATSSKQSASSIRDAAAAMVVVGEPDSVRLSAEPIGKLFLAQKRESFSRSNSMVRFAHIGRTI